jgi:hypothetical protein
MVGKKLTQLERLILEALEEISKPFKRKELSNYVGINVRSTRHGLANLIKAGIISTGPDLKDLRSVFYFPKENIDIKRILSS